MESRCRLRISPGMELSCLSASTSALSLATRPASSGGAAEGAEECRPTTKATNKNTDAVRHKFVRRILPARTANRSLTLNPYCASVRGDSQVPTQLHHGGRQLKKLATQVGFGFASRGCPRIPAHARQGDVAI